MQSFEYFTLPEEDSELISDTSKHISREKFAKIYKICKNLETIIENSTDSIFVTDKHGNIVKVNKAYEALSGESRETLLGTYVGDMQREGLLSESCTVRVLETRKTMTIEQKIYKTNRTTHVTTTPILDKDGDIVMAISNNRDLKEIEALKDRLADIETQANRYKKLVEALRNQPEDDVMIAHDKHMLDTLYRADKIAKVDATILIMGETGTGKEQIVKYIHQASNRSDRELIKINCGSLTPSLIESELFGYERGSFTGANACGKVGFFEAADNGTLFLDEVGELSMDMQVKLLRVLQEGEFFRIGGTKPVKINVRIIAATNRDLQDMVHNGLFRPDLFYRLNVATLTIPPLRKRVYDIIPLATQFLSEFNKKYGMEKSFSVSAFHALKNYNWPGNVRELRNVVEQALVMSDNTTIQADELPFAFHEKGGLPFLDDSLSLDEIVARVESYYIQRACEKHGTVRAAARSLGIKTTRFLRKKNKYSPEQASS